MQENNIAKNLKTYRELIGFSQQELADRLFVTQQAYAKWESSQSFPKSDKLEDISELFGISSLFFYDNEPVFTSVVQFDKEYLQEKAIKFLDIQKENPRQKERDIIASCIEYFEDMPVNTAKHTVFLTEDESAIYEKYYKDKDIKEQLSFYKRIRSEEYDAQVYGLELLYEYMYYEMEDNEFFIRLGDYRKRIKINTWLTKHSDSYNPERLRQGIFP